MADFRQSLNTAVRLAGEKPDDGAKQGVKRAFNTRLSNNLAQSIASELRDHGMDETRPGGPGDLGGTGVQRRIAGGVGAKRVGVSWATEESGLILACSVKSILFRDLGSGNFQKNLTNRRSDLAMDAVTLHRRFPFAVVTAIFAFDKDAANDGTEQRNSTFRNAFSKYRLFTGRSDPIGREEQFEHFYFALVDTNPFAPGIKLFSADNEHDEVEPDDLIRGLVDLVAERNFDLYEKFEGRLKRSR